MLQQHMRDELKLYLRLSISSG